VIGVIGDALSDLKVFVIKREVKDKRCHEHLDELIRSTIEGVKDIEDVGDWIADQVLSISRKQTLLGNKWETDYYELQLIYGGPGLWITTDGRIIAAWWGDYLEVRVEDEGYLEKLKDIEAHLDELAL